MIDAITAKKRQKHSIVVYTVVLHSVRSIGRFMHKRNTGDIEHLSSCNKGNSGLG